MIHGFIYLKLLSDGIALDQSEKYLDNFLWIRFNHNWIMFVVIAWDVGYVIPQ